MKIKFLTNDDTVSNVFDGEDDSFSLAIVEALMDQVDLQKTVRFL